MREARAIAFYWIVPGRPTPHRREVIVAERGRSKQLAPVIRNTYCPVMPFMDPNKPDQPLTLDEIRAMLDRGRAEAEAGQGADLNVLLAQWEAEDAADLRVQRPDKPSAA
jgi:hypothetical protein